MTTGQKYVDGPDCAQTSSPAVETPFDALAHHHQRLADLLDQFVTENSPASDVESLLDGAYNRLLYQVEAHADREANPHTTYTLREHHLDDLYAALRLTYFVVAIKERWGAIQSIKGREEVGHEN